MSWGGYPHSWPRKIYVLLCLSLAQLSLRAFASPPFPCAHSPTQLSCVRYLKNYDGDTITVDIPEVHPLLGSKISVRVRGLDTPERRGKSTCEKQAAKKAQALVEQRLKSAKRIDLVDVSRDKYFRILANVHVDGQDLGEVLLSSGLAYTYDGGKKKLKDWCEVIPRTPAQGEL